MANNPTLFQQQVNRGVGAWTTDLARAHVQAGHVRIPIVPRGVGAAAAVPVRLVVRRGIGSRPDCGPGIG